MTVDPALLEKIREVLREFERPSNTRAFLRLAADWLAIAAGMSAYLLMPLLPGWPAKIALYLLALFVIAGRLRGLESCTHEAAHNAFFRTRSWNTRMQFLFSWPIFDQVQSYRREHMIHHRKLGRDGDPAYEMYRELGVLDFPRNLAWSMFLRPLLGYHSFWFVRDRLSYCRLDRVYALQMLCFWGPVAAIVTWTGTWAWFALYYLVPTLLILPALLILSEITDHVSMFRACPVRGTRNNVGTLMGLFLHAHDDGFHLVHHINPRVPGYLLRRAHLRLRAIPGFAEACVESHGYVETLRQLASPLEAAQGGAAA